MAASLFGMGFWGGTDCLDWIALWICCTGGGTAAAAAALHLVSTAQYSTLRVPISADVVWTTMQYMQYMQYGLIGRIRSDGWIGGRDVQQPQEKVRAILQ